MRKSTNDSASSDPVFVSSAPFITDGVRALVVHCSDGRFGQQIDEFVRDGLNQQRFDRVALPGGAACLAGGAGVHDKLALARQIEFLTREHGLEQVILIAHQGCGYYKDAWTALYPLVQQQAKDLQKAAAQIRLWNPRLCVTAYFAQTRGLEVAFQPWTVEQFLQTRGD